MRLTKISSAAFRSDAASTLLYDAAGVPQDAGRLPYSVVDHAARSVLTPWYATARLGDYPAFAGHRAGTADAGSDWTTHAVPDQWKWITTMEWPGMDGTGHAVENGMEIQKEWNQPIQIDPQMGRMEGPKELREWK